MKLYPLYNNQLLLTSSSPTFVGLTLTGNLVIPDAGYIGSVSDTTALQIEADGDILLSSQLGIGITPSAQLEISKDAANATLIISCYHDTEATTPLLTMRKGDGTAASPALVDDNAVLGTINFDAYDGSGWHTGAKIEARIAGTPSDGTDMPTELTFWTCPDGSATPLQRMTILANGYVGIGVTAPAAPIATLGGIKSQDGPGNNIVITGAANSTLTASGGLIISTGSSSNAYLRSGSAGLHLNDNNAYDIDLVSGGGDVGIGVGSPTGRLSIGDVIEGGTASLNVQTAHETHTLAGAGTSVTTTLDIPTGSLLLGAAFCVNTAVVDDAGNDTWSAAFSGGDASAIVAAVAPAQNTKAHSTIVPAVAGSETQITFTPQGGNFSAGIIEVVAYYIDLTDLANV